MKKILGVNHQFLYPHAITDAGAHTETLKEAITLKGIDALDCWLWRGERAKEELAVLADCGKIINYNIGDRFGEDVILPCSPEKAEQDRAYDITMREIEYALRLNSKKIIFGSGPDMPDDHDAAVERYGEFVFRISKNLPDDVWLALEPTDWDIDKHFLFGPVKETRDFIHKIRKNGFERIGMLLDQCHIPIMHETLESAVKAADDTLVHIHLGNCVIKDKSSQYYGDKHVAWDYPGGEYTSQDGKKFLELIKQTGYFNNVATVTFEMRKIEGKSAVESVAEWVSLTNTFSFS